MQKLWVKEWFGIKFREFAKLNEHSIAGNDFYENFYKIFHERFSRYEDLPNVWRSQKDEIAKEILEQNNAKKILSIGCGVGYIEKKLCEIIGDSGKIVAIEPSRSATRWLESLIEVRHGYFPDSVKGEKFDLAYASTIDYTMSDIEYLKFLQSMYNSEIPSFFLVNLISGQKNWDFIMHCKEVIKSSLSFFRLKSKGQFWGYLRNLEEQVGFLQMAGYQKLSVGKHRGQETFWIKATR